MKMCNFFDRYYSLYGNIERLAKEVVKGVNSVEGVEATLWQACLMLLILSGCSKLYSIQSLEEQRDSEYLKKIYIGGAPIYSQSRSSHSKVHKDSVTCLLPSLPIFPCICELDLSFCNLVQIPEAIGSFCCLKYLDLSGNNFSTLPSLKKLSQMFILKLQHCKQLKYLPEFPSRFDFPSPIYFQSQASKWDFEPLSKIKDAGLCIFNCPEVVEREHCASMVFTWIIQILQYRMLQQNKFVNDRIGSVTPGSEIPRWFNNQHVNMGCCISIDPSPVIHDSTWIGVVCCVVFKLVRHAMLSFLKFPLLSIWLGIYVDQELVSDIPEHVCLFVVERSQFMQRSHPGCLNFEFRLMDRADFRFEVKKYGYRWVYEQGVELPNLTMIHSVNSSARKRKFWGIEEKEGKRRKQSLSAKLRKDDAANSCLEKRIMLLQNQFQNLAL